MKLHFRHLFITAMLSVLCVADVLAISASEYATILNLSGRQRMLTQKMSKEAFLIAANINADENRQSLASTAALFDKTLMGLRDGDASVGLPATSNKSTLKMLGRVEKQWTEFKTLIDGIAAGSAVPIEQIAKLNPPLLKNMNTVVRLYEKSAKRDVGMDAGVVINLSGKQRMLTQKMSKEALLVYLNHSAEENKGNVRATADLFERTLKGLRDGDTDLGLPGTTQQDIIDQLDKVAGLWIDFKPVIEKASSLDTTLSNSELLTLSQLNLPLLKEMNKAVGMYENQH